MIVNRAREVAIETPEGVRFSLSLAGPAARFGAWLIDLLIIAAAMVTLAQFLSVFRAVSPDIAAALTALAYFVLSIGYTIVLEWRWRGQTFGKRVLGIRVVDAQGFHLQLTQIFVRNLLRFVDLLPSFYLLGGAALLLTRDAQRLGDLAANTIVIRQRHTPPLNFDRLLAHGTTARHNSLLENRPLAARLRQKTPPALAAIAYEALARREEIAPPARLAIFERAAAEFRALVPFPEPLTEGMTDEQYVRAALEAITRG